MIIRFTSLQLVVLGLLIGVCVNENSHADEMRPNIVLVMSDDMGFSDIGCYGGEIQTPNLDALASQGLQFTQFYNAARCCPTRASLLSGLYQHQAGIGLMTGNQHLPGYRGELGRDVMSIAEVLSLAGYRRYMTGKWHVTSSVAPTGPKTNWPLQRGFEKFYGTIQGAGSFYDPATLCRGNTYITPVNDTQYQPQTYYYTDAISDNAVMFLREHQQETPKQPFFLYVSYTAAHWPMHALPQDITKYKGQYDAGFDAVRQARFSRLKQLGLIDPAWQLSPCAGNWDKVKDKAWEARNMEVYAAMVDNMDQGIGRIMNEIKRQGQSANTLFLYLQDNGGCAEGYGRNRPKKPYATDLKPMGPNELQTKIWPPMQTRDGRPVRNGPDAMAGPADSYCGYGRGWANVSNTPFKEYKHYTHEGGIATPLILHWPQGMRQALYGQLETTPCHLIDIMATCVQVAQVTYPTRYRDTDIQPLEGTSLVPLCQGKSLLREDALYFEHHLNCAIRAGQWKLVRKGDNRAGKLYPWELYDMKTDRTEMNNLAQHYPDKVQALAKQWYAWAQRARVLPWPYKVEISPLK